jgi:starvation-inducible DNA-binding protein
MDVIQAWNQAIANATVLYQKLRHYHWNVVGENFFDLHDLFGKLYDELAEHIDQFAERVRQLESVPIHTLTGMLSISHITESPGTPDWRAMCEQLIADYNVLIGSLSAVVNSAMPVGDRPSVYLVDTVVGGYQKHQWMLRSFAGRF